MAKLIFLLLVPVTAFCFSQENSDSTKHPLKVSVEVSVNSNGIAPIPAFAYGKPTAMANILLEKNRFSYNPQLSYGFNIKPWIIDNWFRYKWIARPKFELRTGLNLSMFFSEYKPPEPDEAMWRGQRWVAIELAGLFRLSGTSTLSLMAWYDKGLETGTISGCFINFIFDKTDIRIGKKILLALNLQTFYINYTDENDGFFVAPKITFSVKRIPVFLLGQVIQPLSTNISPSPGLQWNIGIGYTIKW
jgi:hypothetical protein